MTLLILACVSAGVLMGYGVFSPEIIQWFDGFITTALGILLLGVGIELGRSKELWKDLKKLGTHILWLPLAIALGSILGAWVVGTMLGFPPNESTAIGAGFGWYSLSGVLLTQIYQVDTGALAFLSNVFRELLAVLMIPFLAKYLGKLTAIAPGGATTMDVTLPLISRTTDERTTLVAFVTGVVLTMLVPILVPFLIGL